MRIYTTKYFVGMLTLVVSAALVTGFAVGSAMVKGGRTALSAPMASASVDPSAYVIPTGSPSPGLPVAEDDPGWDCRVQGDFVCKFQGDLWLNVSHLPPSLYARCLIGLTSTGLSPEVASIDTVEICEPLRVNGG